MTPGKLLAPLIGVALALAAAAPSAPAAILYVNPGGLCGGHSPCYPDLQSAIDAAGPGSTILVQAGLYSLPATVIVNKPVQILGPQTGVSPLPSKGSTRAAGSASEAIFDGGGTLSTLIRVTSGGVLLDGIEVRNGTGDLVDSPAGMAIANVTVSNSIVHASSGDEGIQLRGVAGAAIQCNHVFDTAGDGINLCCGSTGGVIRFNEIHDIGSQDAALYVYQATNTSIEGNLVYNATTNEGIKLGSKGGDDASATGGTIRNNTVHHTRQDGIAVYMSHTTVACNEVWASRSENGGIYVAWAVANVTVEDNHVHDNTFDTGKWGDPAGIMIGSDADAGTITVRNNRLDGNVPNGLSNKATGLLVAENNWWGAASGPGPAGPGSGDRVSSHVDYDPWLTTAPSPECGTIGTCPGGGVTPVGPTSWGRIRRLYR